MGGLGNDLRFAWRTLRRSPGFTLLAVGMLGLGIGANAVMFSAVDAALLRPLPYPGPDRLVVLWGTDPEEGVLRSQVSATNVHDVREASTSFDELATFAPWNGVLTGEGEAERLPGMQVGDDYFDVLRQRTILGRTFRPEEQVPGEDRVLVLTADLWRNRFEADPEIVGRAITVNQVPYTVVGVLGPDAPPLPRSLVADAPAFYRPVAEPPDDSQRDSCHLRAIGRLKEGVTLPAVQAEVDLIATRLARDFPEQNAGTGLRVVTLAEDTVGELRTPLWTVLAAVGLVLLIACANVANLLLARSMGRAREVAVRRSLGASRGRLVRQLLTESLLLSALGGGVGVLLAIWGMGLVVRLAGPVEPLLLDGLRLDARVLGFLLATSALTALLFGLAPAWHSTRAELFASLKGAGRGLVGTPQRLRSALVVFEVAVAMLLVIGAGLLVRTVINLQRVDPGFRPDRLLTMNVWLPSAKYPEEAAQVAFFRRGLERIEALPGVEAAGAVSVLPMGSNFDRVGIAVEDHPFPPGREPYPDRYVVTPGYFGTMGIPLVAGRLLRDADGPEAPPVVVVSDTMARRLWPGDDPIGKRVQLPSSPGETSPWRTVVGVVGDVQQYALDRPPTMQLYLPQAQYAWPYMTIAARAAGDPALLAGPIRGVVREVDPDQAVFAVATMQELLAGSISRRRLFMGLLAGFAGMALLLSASGLYAVLAFSVGQRTREIGVRIALGARAAQVLRMILSQGLRLVLAGILAGGAAALAATRLLARLLFGVGAADPATFLAVATGLVGVALLATYLPARRAARLDAMAALRDE